MMQRKPDSRFLWMNGEFVPYENAHVHALSHSLHYGCTVFEGLRAYKLKNGKTAMFRVEAHYERFIGSMVTMGYASRYSVDEYVKVTKELIKKNEFQECYVRPFAYINDSVRGLKLPEKPEVLVAIAVWPWGKYMGDEGVAKGIRVRISSYSRPDVRTYSNAKLAGNYLISVMARREATQQGYDEAVLLDPDGFVAEGSGENIFIVKNGQIATPPTGYILPGITRDSVMTIAKTLGYEIKEKAITREELFEADEVFFTGTAAEVTPIREVNDRPVGAGKPGPITLQISEKFFEIVQGKAVDNYRWLNTI